MARVYVSAASRAQHALANALTAANLTAGVAATLTHGGPVQRSTLVLLGACCDTFDGTFARRAGHATNAGARADGFGDVVTCGIAPTILLARIGEDSDSVVARLAPHQFMAGIAFRVIKNGFPARTSHLNEGLPVTGAGIVVALGAQARLSQRAMGWLSALTLAAMTSRLSIPSGEALIRPRRVRANGFQLS